MKPKIKVIVGSSRPNRTGRKIADWFMLLTESRTDMNFELIDLADVNLPMFDEPIPPLAGQYSNEHTKQWAEVIGSADGFVFVTPEYNHSFSAVLKNAIDYLNAEWNHKPVAFVAYGGMGGVRAIEQLINVAAELRMVTVKDTLMVTEVWSALDENDMPKPEYIKGSPEKLFDELAWWTGTIMQAKKTSQAVTV